MTKQELKKLIREVISEEMASNDLSNNMKVWDVAIMNNFYTGKYPDYSAKYYPVLASSEQEAKQVVLNNADAILQDLLSKKFVSGKRVLPPSSAVPISDKRIGNIKTSKRTSNGYTKIFSPNGVVMAKLNNGNVEDIKE